MILKQDGSVTTIANGMKKAQLVRTKDTGFSLVEALATVVVFGLVMVAIGTFFVKTLKQNQNVAQATQDREFSRDIDQALTSDFETLGNNMTVGYSEVFPINEVAAFFPNKYYSVAQDEIIREESGGAPPLVSNVLWQGTGKISIRTNTGFDFRLVSSSSAETGILNVNFFKQDSVFNIYEGAQRVYSTTLPDGSVDFEVFKMVAENRPGICLQAYRLGNQEVYRSEKNCSEEWFQTELMMDPGVMNYALTAANCRFNDDGVNPVRLPVFPMYEGVRASSPLISTQQGFALLKAHADTPPLYLAEPVYLTDGEKVYIHVTGALSSEQDFRESDVFLIADYWQNRSCMIQILENAGNGTWLVLPVTKSSKAGNSDFQSMYSMPSDFGGHTFPAGVKIIKMDPPVSYETQELRSQAGLFRREGSGPWVLIMPSVAKFRISEDRKTSGINYNIAMATISERTEQSPDSQNKSVAFAPRGLSRSSDIR
jgi:type II secretory pathway pseudopilin PulG